MLLLLLLLAVVVLLLLILLVVVIVVVLLLALKEAEVFFPLVPLLVAVLMFVSPNMYSLKL